MKYHEQEKGKPVPKKFEEFHKPEGGNPMMPLDEIAAESLSETIQELHPEYKPTMSVPEKLKGALGGGYSHMELTDTINQIIDTLQRIVERL